MDLWGLHPAAMSAVGRGVDLLFIPEPVSFFLNRFTVPFMGKRQMVTLLGRVLYIGAKYSETQLLRDTDGNETRISTMLRSRSQLKPGTGGRSLK